MSSIAPGAPANQPSPHIVPVPKALELAAEHFQAGRRADVETICLKVLEVEPENPYALHLIGVLAHLAGKQGIALALIEKAIRGAPRDAQFRYNLGVVYAALKRPGAALGEYREAVTLNNNHAAAWGNLGATALELNRFDEALAAYAEVLRIDPANVNAALARGVTFYAARRLPEAATAFDIALQLGPNEARVHWERSHLLLLGGDFAAGWEEYEHRFFSPQSNVWNYPYPYPRWQGQPLAGKTILLHGEQGLGDEIMFGSIYPEVIAEAARTVICCQPHLLQLFRDSFPKAEVHPQLRADADAWTKRPAEWMNGAPQRIDFQIPFGSLARLRRRSLAEFRPHRGYLSADKEKTAAWKEHLAQLKGLRVGICWAANPAVEDPAAARRSRGKSLTLKQLEPLLAAGVSFVSLQTWEAAAQLAAADPHMRERIFDASARLSDFSQTAALVMNLDLVITVDTSVAHLAGALGRPVWVLLPWQSDWRWHEGGETTEWYPSAKLYRQPALGDWESAITRVAADLAALAAKPAKRKAAKAEKTPA